MRTMVGVLFVLLAACVVVAFATSAPTPSIQGTWELKSATWSLDAKTT